MSSAHFRSPSSDQRMATDAGLRTPLPSGGGGGGRRRNGSRGATPSTSGAYGGLASVRVVPGTASVRAVADSSLFPPSGSTVGGVSTTAAAGNKINNLSLALDPQLPMALSRSNPLWHWLLGNLLILAIYGAAFVFAGTALPVPSWSDRNDRLTLIGWGAHLLGALIFILNIVALIVKRGPFFPKILLANLLSLVCFVVGSVLHTTHLGLSLELAELEAARNGTAIATDAGDGGSAGSQFQSLVDPEPELIEGGGRSRLTDSLFAGGDEADLSIQLQWAGALALWIYMGVLVWRAPRSSENIADAAQVAKHKLLLELRQLAQFNLDLAAQMEEEEQQEAAAAAHAAATAAAAAGSPATTARAGDGSTPSFSPCGSPPLAGPRLRAASGASAVGAGGNIDADAADILTIEERPMTGTFVSAMGMGLAHGQRSVPATPVLQAQGSSGTGSAAPSRPVTTTPGPAAGAGSPQPSESPRSSNGGGEHAMRAKLQQEALAIQEALDEEARYM